MIIQIGNKTISNKHPCFIIAELGVNHNGDIKKAKRLIDLAKKSGADAVKFQTWITEEIVTKEVGQAEYQAKNTGKFESQYDMLKKLELSFGEFEELKNYADNSKIIFLSTPDDEKSVDFLDKLGVLAFKIGSGELTNNIMIEKIAKKKKPIILSTGMANLREIKESVDLIHACGNTKLILLHCTSQYPTEYQNVNLKAMITLKNKFNTIMGYSDHTLGLLVPQLAVALGAKVIEKHFTYNKNAVGPDHRCSLDPSEFSNMVQNIRAVELILGKKIKKPADEELKTRRVVRKTIVAQIDISKGTIITRDMLTVKRSNGTINPNEIAKIIGKIALNDIKSDQPIKLEDFNHSNN